MKKQFKGFIQGVIVATLILCFALPTLAAWQKQATLHYNDIKITVDGEPVEPRDANGNAVEPFIIDGTTYLPVRGIAEALGLNVTWDGATNTAVLTGDEPEELIWITRTGSKYHRDGNCNGGTYWQVPLESAIGMGLTPCDKCAK
ncbi:MAG: stalk domain-containing protein [Candidatus Heteroscillospira sp.]|jgi:hypothetical protein